MGGDAESLIRSGRRALAIALAAALLPAFAAAAASTHSPRAARPLDHVIVVIMENKSYTEARRLPVISRLIASGTVFTNSYAVGHPSLPNYLALWAGSKFGVKNDDCPAPGSPYHSPNLGQACEAAGLTWRAYCESLPTPGDPTCGAGRHGYQRKHAPWTDFDNLNQKNARPFKDFAEDVAAGHVPNLVFLVPDQCNSGHDPCDASPLEQSDRWLGAHMDPIRRAAGPRGLIVLTWDEDDYSQLNRVLTVFAGPRVRPGFEHKGRITHYTLLRTICDCLGLPAMNEAAKAAPIDDVWLPPSHGKRH